ncbi:MAG: YaeQ family protein [Planctomycetaceae bacterium]|jgi:uncharacterized protein YaeQ|nr:YaeQ family protein [Planctomycetaceae bacterium]
MGTGATLYRFEIELSDSDRHVYETLELRVARHPSESTAFLIVRVLAYCLEFAPGLEFSKGGISDTDEPALSLRDLTGQRLAWIEIGAPSADRLHRASKSTPRVALYTDRRLELLRTPLEGERIHRASSIQVLCFPQAFLKALEPTLDRNPRWQVSISDAHLYVTAADQSFDMPLERSPLLEE